jgi:hypothetical protein
VTDGSRRGTWLEEGMLSGAHLQASALPEGNIANLRAI